MHTVWTQASPELEPKGRSDAYLCYLEQKGVESGDTLVKDLLCSANKTQPCAVVAGPSRYKEGMF